MDDMNSTEISFEKNSQTQAKISRFLAHSWQTLCPEINLCSLQGIKHVGKLSHKEIESEIQSELESLQHERFTSLIGQEVLWPEREYPEFVTDSLAHLARLSVVAGQETSAQHYFACVIRAFPVTTGVYGTFPSHFWDWGVFEFVFHGKQDLALCRLAISVVEKVCETPISRFDNQAHIEKDALENHKRVIAPYEVARPKLAAALHLMQTERS
jgi:hypothetical protein